MRWRSRAAVRWAWVGGIAWPDVLEIYGSLWVKGVDEDGWGMCGNEREKKGKREGREDNRILRITKEKEVLNN